MARKMATTKLGGGGQAAALPAGRLGPAGPHANHAFSTFSTEFGFLTLMDHCHLDPRLGRTTAPATMHGVPGACQWHDHGGMTGRGGQGYLSAALQGQAVFCSCPCAAPGGCAREPTKTNLRPTWQWWASLRWQWRGGLLRAPPGAAQGQLENTAWPWRAADRYP